LYTSKSSLSDIPSADIQQTKIGIWTFLGIFLFMMQVLLLRMAKYIHHHKCPSIFQLLKFSFSTKPTLEHEKTKSCSTSNKILEAPSKLISPLGEAENAIEDDDMENMFVIGPGPQKEIEWR